MTKKETNKKPAAKKGRPGRKPKAKVEKQLIEEVTVENTTPVETVEETEQVTVKEIEVINGDPAVVSPVEENDNKEKVLRETTSLVPEKIYTEIQPEEYEASEPTKKKIENKPKQNIIKRVLGYFWNGQEMDY
jgi:hypothetical protein